MSRPETLPIIAVDPTRSVVPAPGMVVLTPTVEQFPDTVSADPDALFRLAFEKGGATPEALAQLITLRSQMRREAAELEFFRAMAELQKQCPAVPRTSTAEIKTKSGASFKFKFADFEQIMETVRPIASDLGLSFTFSSTTDGRTLTCTMTARHKHGHAVDLATFTLPTETASAMSPQQAVGAALTFAKRQCLVSGLGLSLSDPDPDHAGDPSPITDEQAATLRALIEETKANVAKVLEFAGRAESVEAIRAADFARVVAALEARRKAAR